MPAPVSRQTRLAFLFASLGWVLEIFSFLFLREPVAILPFVLLSTVFGSIMAGVALYHRAARSWQLIFAMVSFVIFLLFMGFQIAGIAAIAEAMEDWD